MTSFRLLGLPSMRPASSGAQGKAARDFKRLPRSRELARLSHSASNGLQNLQPPGSPPSCFHLLGWVPEAYLNRTSSSAIVGWIAVVASKSALVSPALIATAAA